MDTAKLGQRNPPQLNLHSIGLALKILERSQPNQVALVEKGDPIADMLHLGQLVGTKENALAGVPRVAQQFPYLQHSCRIKRRRGLVENQQFRIVDQRLRKRQPLLHAARILPRILALIGQTNRTEKITNVLRQPGIIHAIKARRQLHAAEAALGKEYRDIRNKPQPRPRLRIAEGFAQQRSASRSGSKKASARWIAVVFPAPFGPRKPRISPSSRLSVKGWSAVCLPNCFEIAENSRRWAMGSRIG